MDIIRIIINIYKVPVIMLVLSDKSIRKYVISDAKRILQKDLLFFDVFLLCLKNSNYISVLLYRLRHKKIRKFLVATMFRQNRGIWFHPNTLIGYGLLIQHSIGCVIGGETIGNNCTIYQGVTIGKGNGPDSNHEMPIIGDNVTIAPNSVVFGHIHIGDNVFIGAGSVVKNDIPANSIVAGNPAHILNKNL